MLRMDKAGLRIVLTVHDEIVVEAPEDDADRQLAVMEQIMREPPAWAEGLPLGVEAGVMRRYGK
jgi:DNA polymerase I-like protein with 3'-5' exonuclease and polymerase domains